MSASLTVCLRTSRSRAPHRRDAGAVRPGHRGRAGTAGDRLDLRRPVRRAPVRGTGLGLAITAAILAAHGGRVELRTAPGEGACFIVLLPLS
ncbi:ATP-binding protein [Nonomuraea angiospora]|uniref:ATP-binding protein n=1 Tax=Nonomuraea angiospora TaxID=46172 RepID=UPI0033182026